MTERTVNVPMTGRRLALTILALRAAEKRHEENGEYTRAMNVYDLRNGLELLCGLEFPGVLEALS